MEPTGEREVVDRRATFGPSESAVGDADGHLLFQGETISHTLADVLRAH